MGAFFTHFVLCMLIWPYFPGINLLLAQNIAKLFDGSGVGVFWPDQKKRISKLVYKGLLYQFFKIPRATGWQLFAQGEGGG